MARTKQTARKSNGGLAPRVTLELHCDDDLSQKTMAMEVCEPFEHNNVSSKTNLHSKF
jgi:hypothetical protein